MNSTPPSFRYEVYFYSLFVPSMCLIAVAMITLYLSTDHFETNIQVYIYKKGTLELFLYTVKAIFIAFRLHSHLIW